MSLNNFSRTWMLYNFLMLVLLGSWGCNNEPGKEASIPEEKYTPGQLTIVTNAMDFQCQDTLTAGWNTINYQNKSGEVHFLVLEKYPEGKGVKDAEAKVVPVFQQAMDLIIAGKQDAGFAEFAKLPEWFSKVEFRGGTGLIAPGKTAQTTVKVVPGTYVMECYVKMPDGSFHSSMGMIKQLVFIDSVNETQPPVADVNIEVSEAAGITTADSIKAGKQCFGVTFKDQKLYENFVGHDVHLVRLAADADINKLESWMNWVNPQGLTSPTPAQFEFLGGTQEMPVGNTAYFTANLSPGNYALIAEVPEPAKHKLLYRFSIQ